MATSILKLDAGAAKRAKTRHEANFIMAEVAEMGLTASVTVEN